MASVTLSELIMLRNSGAIDQDEYDTRRDDLLRNVHPSVARILEQRELGILSTQEYDVERQRILEEEIGIAGSAPVMPAPKNAPSAAIPSAAEIKRAEESRIAAILAANKGKISSFVPSGPTKVTYIPRSIEVKGEDGVIVRRLMTAEEHKAALEQEKRAAEAARPRPALTPSGTMAVPPGYEIRDGVIKPIERVRTEKDPVVEAIRERWKAGEFGPFGSEAAKLAAQKLIKAAQSERPIGGQIDCSVCKGAAKNDRIIGKLCRCGGKGVLNVDVDKAAALAAFGCGAADPLPENPESLTYTAWLSDGRRMTCHADHGQKAIRSACESLRASATGFQKVVFDAGNLLVLHNYRTQCPACHGRGAVDGKTCTNCEDGRVYKVAARFHFRDHPDLGTAREQADRSGLLSMTEFDSARRCGKKKCKGMSPAILTIGAKVESGEISQDEAIAMVMAMKAGDYCHACKDVALGGYQRQGYTKCGACAGRGKLPTGDSCEKCRGKGYFNTTEFYWTAPVTSERDPLPYSVTNEIRRADLLSEAMPVKRDRNIAVKVGEDTVMVGPGRVPSRKSGAVCAVTGTKRNPYDTASPSGDKKGIGWNMRCRDYKATFSGG